LYNELHDWRSSPNVITMIKSRACSTYGERRNGNRVSVGKSEGKRPLGRPTQRREDNIKMDHQEIVWVVWTGLIWLMIGTSEWLL
jgi:hypothetical protein